MTFRLVLAGPDNIVPITLEGDEWLVGRTAEADIHIDDPKVSRRHALLWLNDGRMYVRDIAARNRTRINDVEIEGETELRVGDRLLFGSTLAELHRPDDLRARVVRGATHAGDTLVVASADRDATGDAGIDVLTELAATLSPVQRVEDAAQLALGLLFRRLPLQRGLVARVVSGDNLRVVASSYENTSTEPIGVTRRMLRLLRSQEKPVCVLDPSLDDGSQKQQVVEIAAPIRTHGQLTGLIYLERQPDRTCSPENLAFVQEFSKILASRIQMLDLLEGLRTENSQLRRTARAAVNFLGISKAIIELKARASLQRSSPWAVAVCGEAGAGKRAFAHWMHHQVGTRAHEQPSRFTVVDCATTDEDPLATLNRAAGSPSTKATRAMLGHDETLCLHNVAALSSPVQRKIARAFSGGLSHIGGNTPVDMRLVVTHVGSAADLVDNLCPELAALVRDDAFEIPPLRERIEDLPILAAFFLETTAIEAANARTTISPRAMDRLRSYDWPRNVAELRQALRTAAILARGRLITPKHLPKALLRGRSGRQHGTLRSLEDVERAHIETVLDALDGNKSMAAKCLGIASSTLYQKMKRYGIGG